MADVEVNRQLLLDSDDDDETLLDTSGDMMRRGHNKVPRSSKAIAEDHDLGLGDVHVFKDNKKVPMLSDKDMNEVELEGDITVPGAPSPVANDDDQQQFNTLDEPVRDTIMRDARAVGTKFLHVLYPKESRSLLREWDLWGPLVLCVFLAMMLQGSTETANDLNDGGPQFAEVFVIYWVGAAIVTMNTKLLGGSISFFQSICVLGYCVLPLAIALIVCRLILISEQSTALFATRCVVTLIAFGWSTFASTAFLAESQPPRRKGLTVYPVFLFYFIISWLVVSHTHH